MRGHSVGIFFTLNISSFDYLNKKRHVIIDLFIDLFCIFKYWRFLEKFHAVPILREFTLQLFVKRLETLLWWVPDFFGKYKRVFIQTFFPTFSKVLQNAVFS